MRVTRLKNWLGIILLAFTSTIYAQDTISTFKNVERHNQFENIFKKEYYYNPANMVDYSTYSISTFSVGYDKQKSELYRLQAGQEIEGLKVNTVSYKKLKNDRTIWGGMRYLNQTQRGIQWNSSLDLDIIGPYTVADSTRGTSLFEGYEFVGGYMKKSNKWSYGAEVSYKAHLAYRNVDPRPKSVSSDLYLKIGLGYDIYKDWKVGVYMQGAKYLQHTSVKFANLVSNAAIYQMQGMGEWNYYFSGKSDKSVYEQTGYQAGFNLSNKGGRDFLIAATLHRSNLSRRVMLIQGSNNDGYEINDVESKGYTITAAKFLDVDNHRFGLKYQISSAQKSGSEIFYTNTENYLTRLLSKQNYNLDNSIHLIEGYYEYANDKINLVAQPFFQVQERKESVKNTGRYQYLTYNCFGLRVNYSQYLTQSTAFSLMPHISVRNTVKDSSSFKFQDMKESIRDWQINDYEYWSANYLDWGIAAKYSFQIKNTPPIYVLAKYNQVKYNTSKVNNYISVSVGITF